VLTAHARDEGASAAAERRMSAHPTIARVLMPGHRRQRAERQIRAGSWARRSRCTAPALDEEVRRRGREERIDRNVVLMPGIAATSARAPKSLTGSWARRSTGCDRAARRRCRRERRGARIRRSQRGADAGSSGDDRAPSAEILVHGELGEEVDGCLYRARPRRGSVRRRGTTDERASDDRNVVLMPGIRR
jgi:hypothetical protein